MTTTNRLTSSVIKPKKIPLDMNAVSKPIKQSSTPLQTATTNLSTGKRFKFDKAFQEKIVQALLIDRNWASQFAEVVDVDYFEFAYLRKVADSYLAYHTKYKEFPSMALLAHIVATDLKNGADAVLKDQVKQFLLQVEEHKDLNDLGYVKEKSLDFCKKIGLQKALEQSIEFIETEKYEKVVDIIKAAIIAGNEHDAGLDLAMDIDARYSETYRCTVSTGVKELDDRKILNGGLGAGELGIVVAPTGVGKSHMLVHIGASALKTGKNVLHYTFESNERALGIRYDSHLLDIDSTECFEHKEQIKDFYEKNAEDLGRLRIKYYPSDTITINSLRGHIEKLALEGFRPDLLLIDYAGIMRSTEKYDLLRLELKKICEELRSFANEINLPVWTAIQSNKEGADKDYVDLTNMAEAYGQAHIADFVIGLSRKSLNKATGYGNLFIAKNRAGIDGIQYQIHLDCARSKLRILNNAEIAAMREQTDESNSESLQNFFRSKIRDYQRSHNDNGSNTGNGGNKQQ